MWLSAKVAGRGPPDGLTARLGEGLLREVTLRWAPESVLSRLHSAYDGLIPT